MGMGKKTFITTTRTLHASLKTAPYILVSHVAAKRKHLNKREEKNEN